MHNYTSPISIPLKVVWIVGSPVCQAAEASAKEINKIKGKVQPDISLQGGQRDLAVQRRRLDFVECS